jgi:hypothetical protein
MQHTFTQVRTWSRWLLGLFVTLLVTTSALAQISAFTTAQIELGTGCDWPFSSLAVNPVDGKVYGFWRKGAGLEAVYKLIRFDGSSWATVSTFAPTGNSSSPINIPNFDSASDDVDLAIDASGRFHVTFRGSRGGGLTSTRGVWYGLSTNGTSWTFTEIQTFSDPSGFKGTNDPVIEVDATNQPHIAFIISDANSPRTYGIRYYRSTGTDWVGETALSINGGVPANEVNNFDMAIDGAGKAHLAIQRETNNLGRNGGLVYMTNSSGSWAAPTVVAEGAQDQTQGNTLGIDTDASNNVYIVYSNYLDQVNITNNASGSFSAPQQINGISGDLIDGSFHINSNGSKSFGYYSRGSQVGFAYQPSGSATWTTALAYTAPAEASAGNYPSAILSNSGRVIILFDNLTTGSGACSAQNTRKLWYATTTVQAPTAVAPTVTTSAATMITTTGSTLGGNVTADGGATVTGRGVVYSSTNTTPTIGGNGVTQSANGTGTGTFSASISGLTAGTAYSVRAYATNSVGTSYGSTQTFTTSAPTITLTPATLPNGTGGFAYSQTVTSSGGTAPYSYAVTAGALPLGMTLSTTGTLSGTTTVIGTFNFTITARDAGNFTGLRAYSLTIVAPTIVVAPPTLPNGTVGVAYSQTFTGSGGNGPYSYALTAGTLPAGMTLNSAGTLAGTPTAGGTFNFTIRATDASTGSGPYSGSRAYTLTIAGPTITLSPASLPAGTVGAVYTQTITAAGGTAPYTFALTAGALPPGVTLSSAGVLSGTPTGGGTYTFTLTANDVSTGTGPYSGSRSYSLTIAAPTIVVAPATLASGTIGSAYTQTITASGGTSSYTYAVTAGALPSGLTLSSAGVLSGTPASGGSFTFTITATDASTGSGPYSGSRSYTVTIAPPAITGLTVTPSLICAGNTVTVTATIGQNAGTYSYTLSYGGQTILGTTTTTVSQTLTADGAGQQPISLLAGTSASYNTATATLTVNPLPVVSITGLASAYCQDAAAVTLTATPAGAGGSFTIDGMSASMLTPMSLTVGQHTVGYRFTDGNGCSNSTSQSVTIKATPPAPSLLTQTGQSYPGSQSAVTVDLNTSNVTLVASGCAGAVNWTGPNNTSGSGTTIIVPTTQAGTFTYQASCTIDGCASPLATATVTVGARLTVLHRDVDNYADNNAIQPLLVLQNNSTGTLPLSKVTLRYYLTVENGGTLGNLSLNYAQVGNQNVRLRYVALNPTQTGATGYVEYSFTDGAGSLAAGANSGPIQGYFTKSDYGALVEPNDYSYNPFRDQLTGNLRITAYYDNVLIAGLEPGSTTQVRAVRALTESKNGPSATQINTYLEVRNEGNVAINYSDLKARYYFTSDGNERLQVEVDEGNISTQLVKLNTPVNGADTYLEISFNQGGQLAPGASTGTIRYRISKPDGGRFNQANDYSYQEQPQDRSQNNRVVVYAGSERIWGQEPTGSARVAYTEAGSGLSVKVLGNPIQNDQVSFEVTGAEGQSLQVQLLTPQGRVVNQQLVPRAEANQRHQLSVAGQAGGLFLLQVSTPTQSQTVKVMKAN